MNKTRAEIAEHYKWGAACDGWRLVASDGLSVIEERMSPGSSERRHFHERAQQFFYVLDGRLEIDLKDGDVVTLEAREGFEVAPGIVHQVFNRAAKDVRFLVISQPPATDDRVAAE